MYSEHEKRASVQRANDEFLRRMLGGEPLAQVYPVFNEDTSSLPQYPAPPACNDNDAGGSSNGVGTPTHSCYSYPSLAMVYAPCQEWKNLHNPAVALSRGTQFADLDLPFDAGCKLCGKGRM